MNWIKATTGLTPYRFKVSVNGGMAKSTILVGTPLDAQ